jgi:hypothetical protein
LAASKTVHAASKVDWNKRFMNGPVGAVEHSDGCTVEARMKKWYHLP